MLEKIKLALRITHTLLDVEITETIGAARAEMVRAGLSSDIAYDDDNALVNEAVKTFCLWKYANNPKMVDGYLKSFQYQLENLRRTKSEE